jgi:hypothetical protein
MYDHGVQLWKRLTDQAYKSYGPLFEELDKKKHDGAF